MINIMWIKFAVWGALILGALGLAFYYGGVAPRAEVAALRANIAQMQQTAARMEKASQQTIKELDNDHKKELADRHTRWLDWLRTHSAVPSGQSVPIIATVCNDEAGNARVTAAVQRYIEQSGRAVGKFRSGVAQLLETCDAQTATLINLQDWVQREQTIGVALGP